MRDRQKPPMGVHSRNYLRKEDRMRGGSCTVRKVMLVPSITMMEPELIVLR